MYHIRISNIYTLPEKIGVYVITHTPDNIHAEKYVGMTKNVYNRLLYGHLEKNIIYIDIYPTDNINMAQSLEKVLIKLIKPVTNIKHLYLSNKEEELMYKLIEDDKINRYIFENNIKIGYRNLKYIIGNEIKYNNYKEHNERMKSVQIEEEVHEMLKEKNKEFREENNYELPLGIIIGKVCRKYLKNMELM